MAHTIPEPSAITCPEEALRIADQVVDMLRTAKLSPDREQTQIQRLGKLHQQLLSRRRILKLQGAAVAAATARAARTEQQQPAAEEHLRPPAAPPAPKRCRNAWQSEALDRSIPLPELEHLSAQERVILRAELRGVIDSITKWIERPAAAEVRCAGAAKKRGIAQVFLAALEQLLQQDAPPAQLAEVFQLVARHELDRPTYQRLLLMAQQRLLLDRQRTTGLAFDRQEAA